MSTEHDIPTYAPDILRNRLGFASNIKTSVYVDGHLDTCRVHVKVRGFDVVFVIEYIGSPIQTTATFVSMVLYAIRHGASATVPRVTAYEGGQVVFAAWYEGEFSTLGIEKGALINAGSCREQSRFMFFATSQQSVYERHRAFLSRFMNVSASVRLQGSGDVAQPWYVLRLDDPPRDARELSPEVAAPFKGALDQQRVERVRVGFGRLFGED